MTVVASAEGASRGCRGRAGTARLAPSPPPYDRDDRRSHRERHRRPRVLSGRGPSAKHTCRDGGLRHVRPTGDGRYGYVPPRVSGLLLDSRRHDVDALWQHVVFLCDPRVALR